MLIYAIFLQSMLEDDERTVLVSAKALTARMTRRDVLSTLRQMNPKKHNVLQRNAGMTCGSAMPALGHLTNVEKSRVTSADVDEYLKR
jgi:hypothetical protein